MEQNVTRYVHIMFAAGALLVAFVLSRTGEWVWSFFAKPNDLVLNTAAVAVAIGVAVATYKNERIAGLATEACSELAKVSWPTRAETKAATVVTIITVLIAGAILGTFDMFWSWFTSLIYAS